MKKKKLSIILTVILSFVCFTSLALAVLVTEGPVLDDMKTSLTGLPGDWVGLSSEACENNWTGIGCNIANTTIIGINLPNQGIIGNIASSFNGTNLINLSTLDISYNGLYTGDPGVDSFITGLQPAWKDTQVVAPFDLSASVLDPNTVWLFWTNEYGSALSLTYDVLYSLTSGGPYSPWPSTAVSGDSAVLTGLSAGTAYYFILNTTSIDVPAVTSASSEVSAITSPGTASGATQDTDNPEACYIATAAYGSYLDPHVQSLRDFRDKYLMKTAFGRELVGLYYRTSPPVAELISRHESARTAMRVALTPVVYGVKYPVLGFAMVIGSGSLGAAWLRRRRKNRSQA